eukprot:COSAG01_NODE_2323_length_7908_cov_43.508388_13_plen_48_part_00
MGATPRVTMELCMACDEEDEGSSRQRPQGATGGDGGVMFHDKNQGSG